MRRAKAEDSRGPAAAVDMADSSTERSAGRARRHPGLARRPCRNGAHLAQPPSGRYQLGPVGRGWPTPSIPSPPPRTGSEAAGPPPVERALADTGEAVFLSVRSGHELLYLDAVVPPAAVRMVGRPGDRDLLYATSQGKVLLAFLPAARREAIVHYLRSSTSRPEPRPTGRASSPSWTTCAGGASPCRTRSGRKASAPCRPQS